jgi:hypothetical protein
MFSLIQVIFWIKKKGREKKKKEGDEVCTKIGQDIGQGVKKKEF